MKTQSSCNVANCQTCADIRVPTFDGQPETIVAQRGEILVPLSALRKVWEAPRLLRRYRLWKLCRKIRRRQAAL